MSNLSERLLRTLERQIERPNARITVDELARVVCVQLARPGTLPRLARSRRADLFEDVGRAAERMRDPRDMRQLRGFVDQVITLIDTCARPTREPFLDADDLKALARDAVNAEAHRGQGDADTIKRAVTRALKERRRGRGLRKIALDPHDPLREVLKLAPGQRVLPRADLRGHIANQVETPLGQVLKDSARFAEELLRPLLGEELWGLCRPIGFADARHRRVLVEVSSSAMAQEVAMRRGELLRRLKSAPGFETVQDVRFEVRTPAVLPVVGGRRPNPID